MAGFWEIQEVGAAIAHTKYETATSPTSQRYPDRIYAVRTSVRSG